MHFVLCVFGGDVWCLGVLWVWCFVVGDLNVDVELMMGEDRRNRGGLYRLLHRAKEYR